MSERLTRSEERKRDIALGQQRPIHPRFYKDSRNILTDFLDDTDDRGWPGTKEAWILAIRLARHRHYVSQRCNPSKWRIVYSTGIPDEGQVHKALLSLSHCGYLTIIPGKFNKKAGRCDPNAYVLHYELGKWIDGCEALFDHTAKYRAKKEAQDSESIEEETDSDGSTPAPRSSGHTYAEQHRAHLLSAATNLQPRSDPTADPEPPCSESPSFASESDDLQPASSEEFVMPEDVDLDQPPRDGSWNGKEVNNSDDLHEEAPPPFDDYLPDFDNLPPQKRSVSEQVQPLALVKAKFQIHPSTTYNRDTLALLGKIDDMDGREPIANFTREQLLTIAYADVMDERFWSERTARLVDVLWNEKDGSPYPRRFPWQTVHFHIASRQQISLLRVLEKMREAYKLPKARRFSWAKELADLLTCPDPRDKVTFGWAPEHKVRKDMLKKHPRLADELRTNADNYLNWSTNYGQWPPYARENATGRCDPDPSPLRTYKTVLGGKACQESASV